MITTHARGAALALCAVLTSLLSPTPLAAQEEGARDRPEDVLPDSSIKLRVDDEQGLGLLELVELAGRLTGRTLLYSPQELQEAEATIHFTGDVEFERGSGEFFAFFQTLLYHHGYGCVIRDSGGGEVVEIIKANGPRRSEFHAGARHVPEDRLDEYRNQTGVVIRTSLQLEHLNAMSVSSATRPFFSQSASGMGSLISGTTGDERTLLLQGFAPAVWATAREIRLADLPPRADRTTRVVTIEHAAAGELSDAVRDTLSAGRSTAQAAGNRAASGSPLTLVPNPRANTLVVAGSTADVEAALRLIDELDVPPAEATPAAEVRIDGDDVEFAIPGNGELSMLELIDVVEQVTGKPLAYHRAEVARPELALSLTGTLRTTRAGFLDFFTALLGERGLQVGPLGGEHQAVLWIRSQD